MRESARPDSLDAIELALALFRAPRRLEQVRTQPLPAGVGRVLRVAGQESSALAEVEGKTGAERTELVDAAFFYIEGVLLHAGADSYRTLGLNVDASPEQIKEHHRLLIRLMHPDRSRDNWTETYAQRINRAWSDLRTPERRAAAVAVAARAASVEPIVTAAPALARLGITRAAVAPSIVPRRRIANMPQRVLALAGLVAIGVVGAIWLERRHAALEAEEQGVPVQAPVAAVAVVDKEPLRVLQEEPVVVAAPVPPAAAAPAPASSEEQSHWAPAFAGVQGATAPSLPSPPRKRGPSDSGSKASEVAKPSAPAEEQRHWAPASAGATEEAASPQPIALSTDEVESVLERFRVAYGRGDLNMLMSLFTPDAQNNRGGRDAIAQDYREFFAASSVHTIAFEDLRIFLRGEEGTATARFAASVLKHSARAPIMVRGKIQFDLRRDGAAVAVARLIHEEG